MPGLSISAIVTDTRLGSSAGQSYEYTTTDEAANGDTLKISGTEVTITFTNMTKPAIISLENIGAVATADPTLITWGTIAEATQAHPFEILAGESQIVRLNRTPGITSIFAKAVQISGTTLEDMWFKFKVYDQ